MDTQLAHQYEPPTLTPLGGLTQLTLAPCKSKHADLVPDHVWHYHCDDGNVIVVTSA